MNSRSAETGTSIWATTMTAFRSTTRFNGPVRSSFRRHSLCILIWLLTTRASWAQTVCNGWGCFQQAPMGSVYSSTPYGYQACPQQPTSNFNYLIPQGQFFCPAPSTQELPTSRSATTSTQGPILSIPALPSPSPTPSCQQSIQFYGEETRPRRVIPGILRRRPGEPRNDGGRT